VITAFAPDGRSAVCGGPKGELAFYNAATGKIAHQTKDLFRREISVLAYVNGGKHLLASALVLDNDLRIFDEKGRVVASLPPPDPTSFYEFTSSADGGVVAVKAYGIQTKILVYQTPLAKK
jgi:WD40 repeat protein